MRDHDPGSSDERWTAFEAEAMPHVDRLFRLALWWERDRREAEDLVQDTLVQGRALTGACVTDGFHVASFRRARHLVSVVSASSRGDAEDVAQAMAGPLSKALGGA